MIADLASKVVEWRRAPERFAREMLGVHLWDKQREIIRAVQSNRRVAVPSCHASGKTKVAACAVVHHLVCYQPSKIITTAPSDRQVKTLLWGEILAAKREMERRLGGTVGFGAVTQESWKVQPDWFALGFATTADTADDNATKFQGFHSPHILIVLDEAAGIELPVWNAIDGLMTESTARVLAIGSPTRGGEFERVCKSKDWRVIRISAFDCPNLQPDAPQGAWGVSPGWVDEMRSRWGVDSAPYQSRVLGLFPTAAVDTLISLADVERALERAPMLAPPGELVSVGCDVARFGDDETVIYVLLGRRIVHVESWAGQDTMKTTGRVISVARQFGLWTDNAHRIAVDDTGIGGAVVDRLAELGWHVDAVNFGAKPRLARSEDRFVNRRTELWWGLREWLRDRGGTLQGLPVETLDVLRSDLCAPKYEQKSDGRIALEPKEKIRDRIGRSPDHGDALALAVDAQSAPPPMEPEEPEDANRGAEPEEDVLSDWRDEAVVNRPPPW